MKLFSTLTILLLVGSAASAKEMRIFVADHNTGKVIKIKEDGALLWDAPNRNGHDVQVLKNGNVLIVNGPVAQEVAPDRTVVWEVGKPLVESAESAQRLPNGNTVIADNGGHRVIEINPNKEIVWEYPVENTNQRPEPTMRQVRRIANGNTLICASTEDKVLEVDKAGKVVWSFAVPFPYLAERLKNGNTLISSGGGYGSAPGYFLVEVNKKGKVVWKYGGEDSPADQHLNWPSGFVRLPNGNTLIGIALEGVIREVSRDKKTVRTIKSPAMKHPATIAVVYE
jgi:outer membrane protein assembly factor BamB